MIRRVAVLTMGAVACCFPGGAAQYEGCLNGTAVADIGNGRCDAALNTPACGFDGGDCCPCTCADGPDYSCDDSEFDCLYPYCGDPAATSDDCLQDFYGDGYCDNINAYAECGYDGGDVSPVFVICSSRTFVFMPCLRATAAIKYEQTNVYACMCAFMTSSVERSKWRTLIFSRRSKALTIGAWGAEG